MPTIAEPAYRQLLDRVNPRSMDLQEPLAEKNIRENLHPGNFNIPPLTWGRDSVKVPILHFVLGATFCGVRLDRPWRNVDHRATMFNHCQAASTRRPYVLPRGLGYLKASYDRETLPCSKCSGRGAWIP